MFVLHAVVHALNASFLMLWEILWPLVLGFVLSALVQTVVSRRAVSSALGGDSLRSLAIACGLGAASSSCSYAAVAIARSLFRKGASFTSAIVFEFASTNLVFELGLLLLILLGWQFLSAELLGGLLMVVLLGVLLRLTLTPRLVAAAHAHAERGRLGRMAGHGAMDISYSGGPIP